MDERPSIHDSSKKLNAQKACDHKGWHAGCAECDRFREDRIRQTREILERKRAEQSQKEQ
jgi:hypothetical protein